MNFFFDFTDREFGPIKPAVLTDSDTRARATVMNIRSISSGTNVVCLTDLSSYTLDYFSSANLTSTSQKDQVVVRSYYARNSGFTYASGSAVPTDDCVRMEAEIQITDHPLNTDGAVFNVSVGSRVGGVIEIELQKIQVIRVPGKADIVVEMTSLNPNTTVHQPNDQVPIRLLIHHSVNSTEEPTNPIIRVIFPPYMSFDPVTAGVVENSTAYTVVTTKQNTSVDFQFPMLLFVDWIELNFSLVANPTRMETPASVGLGVSAVTLARAVCTNSTAFYHCGDISAASYLISSVGCASGSLGMSSSALIQDCQITASTAATAAFAPQNARPGGSTYWAPALGSVEPYIELHFGNLTEISAVSVALAADSASITGFKLMSSFDGVSYSEAASGTTLPFTVPSAFVTRFLRFVITSVSDTTKKLTKIQIDPQGCFRALDVTISDTCPYVPPTRFTDNIKTWRHAVVDATNKIVYFCIYHTIKMRTLCYSGATDGTVWQAAPPYIGYFSGVDKSVKPPRALCVDAKDAAYVYTKDGLFFSPMSKADFDAAVGASATFIAAKVVPSTPAVSVDLFNGWTADNTGIKLMGALKVDWSTCCN
ncbi:unnamed protein product [Notodromas monacha]|uniref:F5/8 type C domain-containing protein n=1 Tax=Notodromas monacha TaxID=399045 RepID=A0A7R9BMH5_9CRUS|nr:unnamed protein product [Notodromas monacha]CAG0917407.1 unnamed protein product [Notodromas monacha]